MENGFSVHIKNIVCKLKIVKSNLCKVPGEIDHWGSICKIPQLSDIFVCSAVSNFNLIIFGNYHFYINLFSTFYESNNGYGTKN